MHFFSPANVMRLVEVVRGRDTAPETLAALVALARRLGKVPVVVGNATRLRRQPHAAAAQASPRSASCSKVRCRRRSTPRWSISAFPWGRSPRPISPASTSAGGCERREGLRAPVADALCELGRFGQKTRQGLLSLRGRIARAAPRSGRRSDSSPRPRSRLGHPPPSHCKDEIVERLLLPIINEGARILRGRHRRATGRHRCRSGSMATAFRAGGAGRCSMPTRSASRSIRDRLDALASEIGRAKPQACAVDRATRCAGAARFASLAARHVMRFTLPPRKGVGGRVQCTKDRSVKSALAALGIAAGCGALVSGADAEGIPGMRGHDHTGITVPDMAQAVDFFVNVVGCQKAMSFGPFADDKGTFMQDAAARQSARGDRRRSRRSAAATARTSSSSNYTAPDQKVVTPKNSDIGGYHIAFYVDDIKAAKDYLNSKGIKTLLRPAPGRSGARGRADHPLFPRALGSAARGDLLPEGHGLREGRRPDPLVAERPCEVGDQRHRSR